MMMRIDSLLPRGWMPRTFVLAAILGNGACNEYDGTERWPGAYPPEQEIDRPKGGTMDAGARDAGGEAGKPDGAAQAVDADAGGMDAGAILDASTNDPPDARPSGDVAPDAQPSGDAAPDAAP